MNPKKLLNLELQLEYYKNFNAAILVELCKESYKENVSIFLDKSEERILSSTPENNQLKIKNKFAAVKSKFLDPIDNLFRELIEPAAENFFGIPDDVSVTLAEDDELSELSLEQLQLQVSSCQEELTQQNIVMALLEKELSDYEEFVDPLICDIEESTRKPQFQGKQENMYQDTLLKVTEGFCKNIQAKQNFFSST